MHTPLIGDQFPRQVTPLIHEAEKQISIIVFDWRWYPDQIGAPIQQFNNALVNKARQKVKIKALLNDERVLHILQGAGIEARRPNARNRLHTKLMLIDGRYTIIGSHNYTQNAFSINHEASVLIDDPNITAQFQKYFDELFII